MSWPSIVRFKPKTGWRPIETARKDGTAVLLWDGKDMDIGCHGGGPYPLWEDMTGYACLTPTHWMPLPKPPK